MWTWGTVVFALVASSVGQDLLEEIESVPSIIEELKSNPNLEKCKPSSFKMFDASGKIPNGILYGNLMDLGNFDECLSIEDYNNETDSTTIGKYCMVKVTLPMDLLTGQSPLSPETKSHHRRKRTIVQGMAGDNSTGLILGWCMPESCPLDQLTDAMNEVLQKIIKDVKVLPVVGGICQTKNDLVQEFSTNDIMVISFFSATLLLIILSTIYDILLKDKRPAHVILVAFSVKTNGKKILEVNKNANQLSCIHGIRFISTLWVLYGHRYAATIMEPWLNLVDLKDWLNNPINMHILNAPISVDTFLVMGGLLVSYVFCLAQDKGAKFNIILFYLHRYLRLTPVLAVVVWFHATLLPFLGSGPLWPLSKFNKDSCVEYWWAPLTYVQNYYNNVKMCVGQTWYLSVDMQLYILSPILLLPLLKWPKYTMAASYVLLLVSIAIPFSISYVRDLPSFTIQTVGSQDYNVYYYYGTHTRYGPWLMGFMLGYYLFKIKKDNIKIKLCPYQVIIGWILALGILVAVVFSPHDLMLHPTKLGNAFFNALHRHGWSLGLCWVIFACSQGFGGPINAFLSWSVFQVLGKFTYTMYLTHLTLMYLMLSATRNVSYFTNFYTMYRFWGDFAYCLAMSICLTLAYESPMVTIEKVLFSRENIKKKDRIQEVKPENGEMNKGFVED